jgi:hypothetical protein
MTAIQPRRTRDVIVESRALPNLGHPPRAFDRRWTTSAVRILRRPLTWSHCAATARPFSTSPQTGGTRTHTHPRRQVGSSPGRVRFVLAFVSTRPGRRLVDRPAESENRWTVGRSELTVGLPSPRSRRLIHCTDLASSNPLRASVPCPRSHVTCGTVVGRQLIGIKRKSISAAEKSRGKSTSGRAECQLQRKISARI